MNVLGIDPGIANCGWAVVDENLRVIDCGVITTTIKLEHDQRIARIYDELCRIATTHRVVQLVNERLPYNSRMAATSNIIEVIGAIALLAVRLGVRRIEYSPLTAKKHIVKNSKATKEEVMQHIKNGGWTGKLLEHSADAAILAMTFLELDSGKNA